ncbi:2-phospho-L-lactate transferase [Vibrio sp. S9_S30]|uniref:2-phospho-L-lactate transferase n=1 Tax=Vibrio sp. S9_S30 TaxID=2720226 RepID=UPI0016819B75|nr:2-phospho-L-lactate transferase [Vibrio sp. S9_S30]MBD1558574.1 2-phospho-L-lactate transferase [Vibrio sp. S9_S30]
MNAHKNHEPKKGYRILVLCGGVGGTKLAEGFSHSKYHDQLSVLGNVADDQAFHGLWVSPDIDTLTYTLANKIERKQGWGIEDDTFTVLEGLKAFGCETWMSLGDKDLVTHIFRTALRNKKVRPSEIATKIAEKLGVTTPILLPTDDRIQTQIKTDQGWMGFQDYFVKNQCQPEIQKITVKGIENAKPTPESLAAIAKADLIVIAPSNPIVSISPILSVPRITEAIKNASAMKIAVSPLIGGNAIKGPAGAMMEWAGYSRDVVGVAQIYQGVIDTLVIDVVDEHYTPLIRQQNMDVFSTNTLMNTLEDKVHLVDKIMGYFQHKQFSFNPPYSDPYRSKYKLDEKSRLFDPEPNYRVRQGRVR